jgi:iron complex transport system ATP-binding protein
VDLTMALVEVEGVSFSFGRRAALSDVSLALEEDAAVALLGANGSGKTTLLRVLLGLARPRRGEVRLLGRPLARWTPRLLAREVAYVPQVHREAFPFTMRDVVEMGRLPHRPAFGRLGPRDRAEAERAMEELGIAHLAGRPYTEVSGGERQLALIARAVAQGARLLVMDEPTNGLDYGNQLRLLQRIARLVGAGRAVVFSTHHPDHALAAAGRVVMLREGRIAADGPAAATVTAPALRALYGVEVRVASVEGRPVCLPVEVRPA